MNIDISLILTCYIIKIDPSVLMVPDHFLFLFTALHVMSLNMIKADKSNIHNWQFVTTLQ